jgi:hypothetical protein
MDYYPNIKKNPFGAFILVNITVGELHKLVAEALLK